MVLKKASLTLNCILANFYYKYKDEGTKFPVIPKGEGLSTGIGFSSTGSVNAETCRLTTT